MNLWGANFTLYTLWFSRSLAKKLRSTDISCLQLAHWNHSEMAAVDIGGVVVRWGDSRVEDMEARAHCDVLVESKHCSDSLEIVHNTGLTHCSESISPVFKGPVVISYHQRRHTNNRGSYDHREKK
jgi:hypothetical protein